MRTLVNRFLLTFICVAFSGSFIISNTPPPEEEPPLGVAGAQQEIQEEGVQEEDAAPSQEAQQIVPPETEDAAPSQEAQQIVSPETEDAAPSQESQQIVSPETKDAAPPQEAQQIVPPETEEEAAGPEADARVGVVGAPEEEKAEEVPAEEKSPAEAAEQAPPPEKVIPKPEEEAEVIPEDKPAQVPAVPSELKGIDTLEINEPGGNWLVKRMWWEKAEEKLEKVDLVIDTIMESRMVFFEKRDKADSDLFDSFYFEVGMDQGQLEEISSFMIQELKEKREKQNVLDKQELAFLKKLEAEKETLKEVKLNVEAVRKLDDAIDDALAKLVEQINLARKYRREAQQLFKDIAKVLDHEKARELYYKMDASWQNIKGIQGYINGKFTEHFNQLIGKAEKQVSRIKILMADLEKKGLGFKEQLKKIKGEQEQKEKKEQERKRQEELKEKLEEKVEEAPGVVGVMLSTIGSSLRGVWNWVASWWRTVPAELIVQETVETVKEVPAEVVAPSEKVKKTPAVEKEPQAPEIAQPATPVEKAPVAKPIQVQEKMP